MQLNLDPLGRIPEDYPPRFFRVSYWSSGMRVADFSTDGEAAAFAIADARAQKCRYDHKVSVWHRARA